VMEVEVEGYPRQPLPEEAHQVPYPGWSGHPRGVAQRYACDPHLHQSLCDLDHHGGRHISLVRITERRRDRAFHRDSCFPTDRGNLGYVAKRFLDILADVLPVVALRRGQEGLDRTESARLQR